MLVKLCVFVVSVPVQSLKFLANLLLLSFFFLLDRQRISNSSQMKVTKMLLIVSTVYILLNLPSYVIRVWVFLVSVRILNLQYNLNVTLPLLHTHTHATCTFLCISIKCFALRHKHVRHCNVSKSLVCISDAICSNIAFKIMSTYR